MLRLRKILTVTLTILLVNLAAVAEAHAGAAQNSTAGDAERVKAEVGRLGAGARVEVKLADGKKLKGQLAESDEEGFMLVDSKGGRTRVDYSDVKSVKRFKKSGWKTFEAKDVALTAGLFGGIFLVALIYVGQTK
jgi:hypothetical protein